MLRTCVFLLIATLLSVANAQVDDCHCNVVLLLDASGSILPEDWVVIKQFATTIVNTLGPKMGPKDTDAKLGIVTFSNDASPDFPIGYNVQAMLSKIGTLQKTTGLTYTDKGIKMAADMLKQSIANVADKDDACMTMKILTDGDPTDDAAAAQAVAAAKAANITIVAIGVGSGVDMAAIKAMASAPVSQNALHVDDYKSLDQIAHALYDKCDSPNPPALNNTMLCTCDVMVILDSSGSITATNWQLMKDYAQIYFHAFRARMLRSTVRMGIISYSDNAVLIQPMTFDYDALIKATRAAQFLAGSTNTAAALALARTNLNQNQRRNLTCQRVQLLTDGASNAYQLTVDTAAAMKSRDNIRITVIGIGAGLNPRELTAVASVPLADNLFTMKDFKNLTALAHKLADICDEDINKTTTAVPADPCHCDLYLVLDASGSIDANEWNGVLAFVRGIVNAVRAYLGPNDVRVALIVYSTTAKVAVNPSFNYNELMGALAALRQGQNGATNTAAGINLARTVIAAQAGFKKCKQVMVLTDGVSNSITETARAAHALKSVNDVTMVAVGVGAGANAQELNYIASPPAAQNLIKVQDFKALGALAQRMFGNCNHSITPTPPLPKKTPIPPAAPKDCDCDVMLVLDGSGSVTDQQFVSVKNFARIVVNEMKGVLGPKGARIGIVQYSTGAVLVSALSVDANALLAAINGMIQQKGSTRTDLGLNLAATELLRQSATRKNMCKTIKLVTDGYSSSPTLTVQVASRIKASMVQILAIGVGGANLAELKAVASPAPANAPTAVNYIMLANFTSLDDMAHNIADKCGKGTRTPTPNPFVYDPCHCDYAIVLDASLSITQPNFKLVLNFARVIVDGLKTFMAPNDTRVAIITFARYATVRAPLSGVYATVSAQLNAIPNQLEYGTNTALGLRYAGAQLTATSRGLGSCKKIILVTDGYSCCCGTTKCSADTVAIAHQLKYTNKIQIIGFLIGANVNAAEMNSVVSPPANANSKVLNAFTALDAAAHGLIDKCDRTTRNDTAFQNDCQCDVFLVFDGSGSVAPSDWDLTEQFCATIVRGLASQLGAGKSRVGLMTFGDAPQCVTCIAGNPTGLLTNAQQLIQMCDTLKKPNGGTRTDLALYSAGNLLRAGNGRCRSMWVVTDGVSNSPVATEAAATRAKTYHNIHVKAIGVGAANVNELRRIASAPQATNAVHIKNYAAINALAATLTDKCNSAENNQTSKCRFTTMVQCAVQRGGATPCTRVSAYQYCAQLYTCPDVLKIWCTNTFLPQAAYRVCAQTVPICNAANAASPCSIDRYNYCYNQNQVAKMDQCSRLLAWIRCAHHAVCPDLVVYQCTDTRQVAACPTVAALCRTAAPNALEGLGAFDSAELHDLFTSHQKSSSHTGLAVVVLGCVVVALVAALVGLVIKYRKAAAEEQETESLESSLL